MTDNTLMACQLSKRQQFQASIRRISRRLFSNSLHQYSVTYYTHIKMGKFNAITLHQVFNFAITLLGLSLISYKKKSNHFQLSYYKVVYSILVVIVIVHTIYSQFFHFFPLHGKADLVVVMLFVYPKLAGHLVCLILVIMSMWNTRKLKTAINNLILDHFYENIKMKREYLKQLALFFFIFISSFLADVSSVRGHRDLITDRELLLGNDFVLYNAASISQFYLGVNWIRNAVQIINGELQGLIDGNVPEKNIKSFILTDNSKKSSGPNLESIGKMFKTSVKTKQSQKV